LQRWSSEFRVSSYLQTHGQIKKSFLTITKTTMRKTYEAINYKEISLNCSFISETLKGIWSKKRSQGIFKILRESTFLDIDADWVRLALCKSSWNCKLYATEWQRSAWNLWKIIVQLRPFREDIWEAKLPFWVFDFIHISHVWACFRSLELPKGNEANLESGGIWRSYSGHFHPGMYTYHRWETSSAVKIPDVDSIGLEAHFIFRKDLANLCHFKRGF